MHVCVHVCVCVFVCVCAHASACGYKYSHEFEVLCVKPRVLSDGVT